MQGGQFLTNGKPVTYGWCREHGLIRFTLRGKTKNMTSSIIGLVCKDFLKPGVLGEIIEQSPIDRYVRIKFYNEKALPFQRKVKYDWFDLYAIKDLAWYAPMTKDKLLEMMGY
jgi:hypothetical protein